MADDEGVLVPLDMMREIDELLAQWKHSGRNFRGAPPPPRIPQPTVQPRDYPILENVSGEVVPAYAVVRVTSAMDGAFAATKRTIYRVARPNGSGEIFLLNGPRPMAASGEQRFGEGRFWGRALFTSADGTPVPDESWGPTTDFKLHKGVQRYVIAGDVDTAGGTVAVFPTPPNPMECVQVWGTGVSANVIPSFSGVQAYSGRIRTAALATSYATGDDCYIVLFNSHDLAAGAIVVTEGLFLMGRYIGNHDFGSGSRPVFDARSPIAAIYETGISLSGNWTVTANTATLIPLDEGWPLGYDTNTNLTHANSSPGTDSSKIYLRYSWNTYKVGFTVSFELPATVAGTQFAQNDQFRFFPITVQPYLDGAALTGHEKHGSLWVPPGSVTTGAASAGTAHTHPVPFTVERVTTDNDFSGLQVTVSGERTIDPGLGFSDNSYVQLKIAGAVDAVVRRADLWVRSQFIPPA